MRTAFLICTLISICVVDVTAQEKDQLGSVSSFQVISQNLELLQAAGFPRPSCKCGVREPPRRSSAALVGFYHTFKNGDVLYNRIVAEQVNYIESSGLLDMTQKIHLTYVGPKHQTVQIPTTSEKFVIHRHSEGMETLSLKKLYDHCVSNEQDNVFYIHSKGTYHSKPSNEVMRQNLMKGVASCLEQDALSRSDVCSWRATPMTHPHMTGNMWAARCSYVAKLLDPSTFKKAMLSASKSKQSVCQTWVLGCAREADSHWILSHPSVVVSDVLPPTPSDPNQTVFTWGYENVPAPSSWAPRVETFPRSGLAAHSFLLDNFTYTALHCSEESYRIQEYVSLYGPGVMSGLPCASMYCQWFPTAYLQLLQAYVPPHARGPVSRYLADMRALGEAAAAAGRQEA